MSSILGGFRAITGYVCMTPLMVDLVPIECIGRWRGILGVIDGVCSIPAPVIGGFIWTTIGPSYLILIPLLIELVASLPLLMMIPDKVTHKERFNNIQ